ncbi:fumarylacetoacetate hydrolase family protein [Terrabacter sp. Ter38]|uniref:fumarylacetoacetate hydrolase family protein n=1 Tax=Terrabacter sp. Ter38 TaxID=2926030 RepID=UPI00211863BC|nr:fumarylacetoacetate hydrolase family protein [Terrabacter sp. Ter38]
MKLFVYDAQRLGVEATDATIVDLTDLVPLHTEPKERMNALIRAWDSVRDEVARRSARGGGAVRSTVTVRAPQPQPRNLIAAPINYHKHQQEMGGGSGVYRDRPILDVTVRIGFFKAVTSIVGPDACIQLPMPDRRFDHEAEVGVIIGKETRGVSEAEALDHVFGFTPLLDITLRGEEDRSWRKSMDTFTPIGPHIITADEVPDPANLDFWLTVNGQVRQKANTSQLIWSIARLVSEYSQVVTLQPGDIIATGTPEGVGQIVPGDSVTLTIPAVGELTMPVVSRA